MGNDYTTAIAANQADEERTKRLFVGFLSAALGVDQTMTGEDGDPTNAAGRHVIANPDGTYSVQGQSVSNVQTLGQPAVAGVPIGFLMLLGIAYFLLK